MSSISCARRASVWWNSPSSLREPLRDRAANLTLLKASTARVRSPPDITDQLRAVADLWQYLGVAVLIGVRGGDPVAELAEFAQWLRAERDLASRIRPVPGLTDPTDLGGVLDTLRVALGSGGVGVALAQSLSSAWLRSRRSDVKLTITVAGTTIEIEAHQVADPTELITRAWDTAAMLTPDRLDRAGSRAILIGAASYTDSRFPAIPNATTSLRAIYRMLIDTQLGGWGYDQVTTVDDPSDCRRLAQNVRRT
ncbi:MAG TPA: hypothetical protein VFW65_29285 [Pseudonocardiaceae bacterium]|nr:hypothetical protein [Pseudonocardiaceae bacterium]